MTSLTLRIENHTTLENGGSVSLTLDGKGAQVGRKPGNDWILPDTSRHISGHHFDVQFQGGVYLLVDVSSNGTFLHGERYRLDGPHQIKNGDRFTIGHYIIGAELSAHPAQNVTHPGAMPEADEFDDVWGGLESPRAPGGAAAGNSGGLQAPPGSGILSAPQMVPVQAPGSTGRSPSDGGTQQPDFDRMRQQVQQDPARSGLSQPPAFAMPHPTPPPPPPQPQYQAPPPAAPMPPQAPAYDDRGAPAPAPSSESFAAMAQPAPQHHPMGGQPGQMPGQPYAPHHQPQQSGAEEMLQGFLEGAGIDDPRQMRLPPKELGRIMGKIARTGTDELMRMLQDRAAVKLFVSNEDRTMRVATGNNPMKFMLDQNQAFEAMFLNPRDGYNTGDAGFENALGDVRRHQTAVIAALQPALAEVLGGLSPDEVEAAAGGGMMGGGGRKAWDEFVKRWDSRAAEGENGMLDAFIKAFSRLYAEALNKQ